MKSHRIEVEPFNLACRYHCSPEVDVSNVAEGDEWGKWSEFLRFQGFAGHPVQQLLVFRNQAHIVVDESVGEGAITDGRRSRRAESDREAPDNEHLLAQRQEDPQVTVHVVVAQQFPGLEMVHVELRRVLRLGCIDMDVIKRLDVQRSNPLFVTSRSPY